MKKIFTLIAMALMAIGANAQENYLITADNEDGNTWMGTPHKFTDNVTLTYGTDASWNAPKPLTNADGDFAFDVFTHYTSGANNPKDGETPGEGTGYSLTNHKLPITGSFWVLKPALAGSFQVGIVLNGNKNFYVTDGEGVATAKYDIKDYQGNVIALDANSKAAAKVYGKVTFNVEADKTYYVFCTGSKIAFMGYKFSTETATIDPATTAAAKETIEAADPNGGGTTADGTYYLSFDGMESANKIVYPNGFALQITGNEEKNLGGGSNITVDGTVYKTIKLSNGAQNTLTLPDGKIANGITFYSYVNKDPGTTDRESYWKEVAGTTFDAETSGGLFTSFKDTENPDVRTYSFGEDKLHTITFTNTGDQCCFVIKIDITTGEEVTAIETISAEAFDVNAPIYNLAGQKVSESYKGVVIQNGHKFVK